MDKILIGTVTSVFKDYCWQDFKSQLNYFQNQGHDVLIVDNSIQRVNRKFKTKYVTPKGTLPEITRDCMNVLRDEFLKGDYTHLFILESDVFVRDTCIKDLLALDSDVANYTYPMRLDRFNKYSLCVQSKRADNVAEMITPEDSKDLINTGVKILGIDTLNGRTLFATGYGCTLVKRRVLEKIKFRTETTPQGKKPFPDSFFHSDVLQNNFKNVLDTDYITTHKNLNNETKLWAEIINIRAKTTRAQRRKNK